jgi:uncharacterized membrane protein
MTYGPRIVAALLLCASDVAAAAATDPKTTLRCLGTEPFWNARVVGKTLIVGMDSEEKRYEPVRAEPFAGQGKGLGGVYRHKGMTLYVSSVACSDGMSDRAYQWTAIADDGRSAWFGCCTEWRKALVQGVKAPDVLNIRAEPNASGAIIDRVKPGATEIDVGECELGWCDVELRGKRGFAAQQYLNVQFTADGPL